jgi:hypothetical protein
VRIRVCGEMRQVAVRKGPFGIGVRAVQHLPSDVPRVTVIAQVASELLRLNDVRADTPIEIGVGKGPQNFLKPRGRVLIPASTVAPWMRCVTGPQACASCGKSNTRTTLKRAATSNIAASSVLSDLSTHNGLPARNVRRST